MTPFVYFNHVKYTLGFWTEKNSHIRRKQDIPYSCPCKTLYDLTLCSDRSKLLHFTTANNQIPGRSSACDLHHWVQRIANKPAGHTRGRQRNQSFAAVCLSLCSGLSQPELKSRNPDELQPRDNSGGLVNPFSLPEHRDLGSASTFQVTVHPSTEAFHGGGEEGDGGSGKGRRGSRKSSQRQAQVHGDPPQQCLWTGEQWQNRDPQESTVTHPNSACGQGNDDRTEIHKNPGSALFLLLHLDCY